MAVKGPADGLPLAAVVETRGGPGPPAEVDGSEAPSTSPRFLVVEKAPAWAPRGLVVGMWPGAGRGKARAGGAGKAMTGRWADGGGGRAGVAGRLGGLWFWLWLGGLLAAEWVLGPGLGLGEDDNRGEGLDG